LFGRSCRFLCSFILVKLTSCLLWFASTDYSHVKAQRILNSELADTLGNLLSRACAKSLNPGQIYPSANAEHLADLLRSLDAAKRLQDTLLQLSGEWIGMESGVQGVPGMEWSAALSF